jgi:hypothetical protein
VSISGNNNSIQRSLANAGGVCLANLKKQIYVGKMDVFVKILLIRIVTRPGTLMQRSCHLDRVHPDWQRSWCSQSSLFKTSKVKKFGS